MRAKSAAEILGLEFDWLASDADGHVALFSTAGGGYTPEAFLQDTDAHDRAAPASTTALFALRGPIDHFHRSNSGLTAPRVILTRVKRSDGFG